MKCFSCHLVCIDDFLSAGMRRRVYIFVCGGVLERVEVNKDGGPVASLVWHLTHVDCSSGTILVVCEQ